MPPKPERQSLYRFDIIKKLSRPRSYIITRQYKMDAFSILSQTISKIMGGKQ